MTTRVRRARAASADAGEQLARLDQVLSAREATPLPVEDEHGWVPGDPLYPRPTRGGSGFAAQGRAGVGYVRPMVEELECTDDWTTPAAWPAPLGGQALHDGRITPLPLTGNWCGSCVVGWVGDGPCWVCGLHPARVRCSPQLLAEAAYTRTDATFTAHTYLWETHLRLHRALMDWCSEHGLDPGQIPWDATILRDPDRHVVGWETSATGHAQRRVFRLQLEHPPAPFPNPEDYQ